MVILFHLMSQRSLLIQEYLDFFKYISIARKEYLQLVNEPFLHMNILGIFFHDIYSTFWNWYCHGIISSWRRFWHAFWTPPTLSSTSFIWSSPLDSLIFQIFFRETSPKPAQVKFSRPKSSKKEQQPFWNFFLVLCNFSSRWFMISGYVLWQEKTLSAHQFSNLNDLSWLTWFPSSQFSADQASTYPSLATPHLWTTGEKWWEGVWAVCSLHFSPRVPEICVAKKAEMLVQCRWMHVQTSISGFSFPFCVTP